MSGKGVRSGVGELMGSGLAIIVLLVFVVPPVLRFVDRQRIIGNWSVAGTFADWRFGSDGTFTEDSLIDTTGKYEVLPGNRMHIDYILGLPLNVKYRFENGKMFLDADNGAKFVLSPKN